MLEGKMPAAVLRQTNRRQVYQYIHDKDGAVTGEEVAGALTMELSAVLTSLDDLVERGMVTVPPGSCAYMLAAQALYAVGISITSDGAYISVLDMRLRELAGRELDMPFCHTKSYYERLIREMESLLNESGLDTGHILGVGLTFPGIIDRGEEKLVMAPTLELWDVPLEEIYRHFAPYSVYAENDANASGYVERWLDGGQRDMIYLSLRRGVGGAILLRDRQYTGDNGRSAEFGHMRIVPGGRQCSCGHKGCLEAYCSTDRLSVDLGVTLKTFFARLEDGDEAFIAVWEEYRDHLTDALSMLRVNFDCDIMLGGELALYLEPHLPELYWELGEKAFFEADSMYLKLARFGPHSDCAGTALRFIDDFLLAF